MNERKICFTIDIEPDYGGLLKRDLYLGLTHLPKLESIVSKYGIRLTAFVTGKTLDDNDTVISTLQSMNAEIEQHSYEHKAGHAAKAEDIIKGVETHRRVLGRDPLGYRSPQGIITKESIVVLQNLGILFDSSIFPTYFPNRFNRWNFPNSPFRIKDSLLVEIPFSVIPGIKIPIGLSYMQLLGIQFFKSMLRLLGCPDVIIFDFHPYELGKVRSYSELPIVPKIGYLRSQRLYSDPLEVLERFIRFILSLGYKSIFMYQLYEEIRENAPIWNWKGI